MKITNVAGLIAVVNDLKENFPETAEVYVKQGYEGFYLIVEEGNAHREVFGIAE